MTNKASKKEDKLDDLIPQFDRRGMDLGLERMKKMIKALSGPCNEIPAIQIAGTNGKGSIASFIRSGLNSCNIKAGITTSPHLISWCERIQINDKRITIEEFRERLIALQSLSNQYHLTPFELVFAVALSYFADNKVDVLVLEVGLGGRLDATTAHAFRPIIAMAGIGLDHCKYLGNNIQDIAREKAAVISKGSKIISAKQHFLVKEVLERKVKEEKATLEWVNPLPMNWKIGLSGSIQRENAAVAHGAIKALGKFGWEIDEQKIRDGFALTTWPGRLQDTTWEGLPLLVDGAHNPHASKQLSIERRTWHNAYLGVHWILGIQRHKEGPKILEDLVLNIDTVWIIPVPDHKSWTKSELLQVCPWLSNNIRSEEKAEDVFIKLKKRNWPTTPPVVAGSLYLIGDLFKRNVITS